jgi:hypothetical protein
MSRRRGRGLDTKILGITDCDDALAGLRKSVERAVEHAGPDVISAGQAGHCTLKAAIVKDCRHIFQYKECWLNSLDQSYELIKQVIPSVDMLSGSDIT